ncbi:SdrD B-like domain-containing protein [Chloroflexota bacterium]
MLRKSAVPAMAVIVLVLASVVWAVPVPAGPGTGPEVQPAHASIPLFPGDECALADYELDTLPYGASNDTTIMTDDYDLALAGQCAGGGTQYSQTGTGPDVVYQLATNVTCGLNVNLDPESADLSLYVLSPDCGAVAANCLGVDDAGLSGDAEDVAFTAAAGQNYYVIVDGWNGDAGGFDLTITETTATGCQLVDPAATGEIGDWVWVDLNQNGLQDSFEYGMGETTTVSLYTCAGTFVDSDDIDGAGAYYIEAAAGSYYVEFPPPPGSPIAWIFTQKDAGTDAVDSDADPVTGRTDCFQLSPHEGAYHYDAGLSIDGTATMRGRVFNDTNQNGIQDPGEEGVANVKVAGYGNSSCSGDRIDWQVTDLAGEYAWYQHAYGDYCQRFYGLPPCWQISPQNQGGDDTKDSDADPATGLITNIALTAHRLHDDVGLYAGVCSVYLPLVLRKGD